MRNNWFWPNTTAGSVLLIVWFVIAFAASAFLAGPTTGPIAGAINVVAWYIIIMAVRALFLLVSGNRAGHGASRAAR